MYLLYQIHVTILQLKTRVLKELGSPPQDFGKVVTYTHSGGRTDGLRNCSSLYPRPCLRAAGDNQRRLNFTDCDYLVFLNIFLLTIVWELGKCILQSICLFVFVRRPSAWSGKLSRINVWMLSWWTDCGWRTKLRGLCKQRPYTHWTLHWVWVWLLHGWNHSCYRAFQWRLPRSNVPGKTWKL